MWKVRTTQIELGVTHEWLDSARDWQGFEKKKAKTGWAQSWHGVLQFFSCHFLSLETAEAEYTRGHLVLSLLSLVQLKIITSLGCFFYLRKGKDRKSCIFLTATTTTTHAQVKKEQGKTETPPHTHTCFQSTIPFQRMSTTLTVIQKDCKTWKITGSPILNFTEFGGTTVPKWPPLYFVGAGKLWSPWGKGTFCHPILSKTPASAMSSQGCACSVEGADLGSPVSGFHAQHKRQNQTKEASTGLLPILHFPPSMNTSPRLLVLTFSRWWLGFFSIAIPPALLVMEQALWHFSDSLHWGWAAAPVMKPNRIGP